MAKRMLVAVALSVVATANLLAQPLPASRFESPPSAGPAPLSLPSDNQPMSPVGSGRSPSSAMDGLVLPVSGAQPSFGNQTAPDPNTPLSPIPTTPPSGGSSRSIIPQSGAGQPQPFPLQPGQPTPAQPQPLPGQPMPGQSQLVPIPSGPTQPITTRTDVATDFWTNPTATQTRFWAQAEYLLWYIRGQSTPPLITSGSATDGIPGALGQSNTQVVYGNNINYAGFSGTRVSAGIYFDDARNWGVMASGFYLGTQTNSQTFGNAGNSVQTFGQPVVIPGFGEQAYSATYPGYIKGVVSGSSTVSMWGWDINLSRNLYRGDNNQWTVFAGFASYSFDESLTVGSNIQQLVPGVLSYLGKPINVGDQLIAVDQFTAHTDFFGAQIGAQYSLNYGRFGIDFIGKFAMGVSEEEYNISGSTSVLPRAGQYISTNGGILAQSTNIGHYYHERFAVAPQGTLNLHYDVTPWARVGVGYNIIVLSSVARPGQVVNRTVDPGRVPSDQAYGLGTSAAQPSFAFSDTWFWAQGINFTISFRY